LDTSRFGRVSLTHLPTPLEPLERLSALLGGPALFIKRDDCTGLAFGGNKARKLEFLLAQALASGADTVVTVGAAQSNHARQTAAAAAKLGLGCVLLLRLNVPPDDPGLLRSGNVLLDKLLDAEVHLFATAEDLEAARPAIENELRSRARKPFFLPIGGATPVGCLGYAAAARELLAQGAAQGIRMDHFVHATGSGSTQAGLIVGLRALGDPTPVLGITVSVDRLEQEEVVWSLTMQTAELLGVTERVSREDVLANSDYYGGIYGVVQDASIEAIKLMARTEGIVLDPIYSGVALAGLIDLVGKGHFRKGQNVVFIHTGGQTGLFGYVDRLNKTPLTVSRSGRGG
jgi:L-cysteate sulfo-lyase